MAGPTSPHGVRQLPRRLPGRPARVLPPPHDVRCVGSSGRGARPYDDPMSDRFYFRQPLSGRDFAQNDPVARQMVNFVYDRRSPDRRRRLGRSGLRHQRPGRHDRGRRHALLWCARHALPPRSRGRFHDGLRARGHHRPARPRDVPIHVQADEAEYVRKVTGVTDESLVQHQSGDIVRVGDVEIELIHTPGHTPGSQCFLVDGRLVAGDTCSWMGAAVPTFPALIPSRCTSRSRPVSDGSTTMSSCARVTPTRPSPPPRWVRPGSATSCSSRHERAVDDALRAVTETANNLSVRSTDSCRRDLAQRRVEKLMHRRRTPVRSNPGGVGDPLDDEVVVEVVNFSESVKDGGEIRRARRRRGTLFRRRRRRGEGRVAVDRIECDDRTVGTVDHRPLLTGGEVENVVGELETTGPNPVFRAWTSANCFEGDEVPASSAPVGAARCSRKAGAPFHGQWPTKQMFVPNTTGPSAIGGARCGHPRGRGQRLWHAAGEVHEETIASAIRAVAGVPNQRCRIRGHRRRG